MSVLIAIALSDPALLPRPLLVEPVPMLVPVPVSLSQRPPLREEARLLGAHVPSKSNQAIIHRRLCTHLLIMHFLSAMKTVCS